jgi:hypothetical protein
MFPHWFSKSLMYYIKKKNQIFKKYKKSYVIIIAVFFDTFTGRCPFVIPLYRIFILVEFLSYLHGVLI